MAALSYDTLGTPIRAAETLVEELETLASEGELSPDRHLAILKRLGLLETALKTLRPHAADDFPEDAVAELGIVVAVQAMLVQFGGVDAATFARATLKMRHAVHQLRLWSAGARAFPEGRIRVTGRRVGHLLCIDGGRA